MLAEANRQWLPSHISPERKSQLAIVTVLHHNLFSFNSTVEYITVVFTKALIPLPVIDMLFICGEVKKQGNVEEYINK